MGGGRSFFGAAFFCLGIATADLVRPGGPSAAAAGAAGLGCLIAAAAFHFMSPSPGPGVVLPPMRRVTVLLAAAGLAASGFCSLGLRLSALEAALIPKHSGEKVDLIGRLASDPRRSRHSHRFFLAVHHAAGKRVREKVAVSAYGRLPDMDLGDVIGMTAKVARLDRTDDYDASLARKSIVAKASVSAGEIDRLAKSENRPLIAANHFRSRIEAAALKGAGEARSGVLLALVMGDQRRVPPGVTDDFRASGLSHLSAVSGQNVAMVLAPLLLVLTALRLRRGARVAVCISVLALFAVVTRWEPSVLRAVLMASAALSAWFFGRRPDAFHLLGVVFFALLGIDPLLLWSIGFQLSFAATAGILSIGPYLAARLGRPFHAQDETSRDAGVAKGRCLRKTVLNAAAIGITAQTAVLPLIALHFGRLSVVALPANLVALPLVAPVTVLGLLGGVIALVSTELAAPIMFLAGVCVSLLEAVARLFGRSTISQISVDGWTALHFAAACLAAAAAGLWLKGSGRAARWPAVMCVIAAAGAGLLPAGSSALPTQMRLTFFDVGQGDAALIEGPSGARVLIDGGPDDDYVANRLARMGASRLDLVIASHGHSDHVAGLGQVLRRLEVRAALDPGIPTSVMHGVAAAAGFSSGPFVPVLEDETMRIGDLTVDFLAPGALERDAALDAQAAGDHGVEGPELNDASVVARVSFGGHCALFPGDLEMQGQESLVEAHPGQIGCTILKAPHHGSGRLVPSFVRSVDPEWVAISVGRANRYGHPSPKAMDIFQRSGAKVLRTDRMGDITLQVDGDGEVTLEK